MTEIEKKKIKEMGDIMGKATETNLCHKECFIDTDFDNECSLCRSATALDEAGYRPEAEVRAETAKEFAEKIKKALEKYRLENEEFINGQWIINASILCVEFTNGILDEIAAEFGKEKAIKITNERL